MDNNIENAENQTSVLEVQPEPKQKKHNIGADAVILTIAKIVPSAIAMIVTKILSCVRTKDEYGTYHQILQVINLLTALLMLGLPKSLNYFLARAETKEEKQRFLSFYYTLNTILSIIVGIVLVCSVSLIERYFKNPAIRAFLYVLAIYPWSKIIASSIENLLIVYHKTSTLIVFRILNSLSLLASVLLVQLFRWSFNEYMILFVATESAFAVAVYIIANYISGGIKPYISWSMTKTVLMFSLPLGLSSVVGTINIELDKLIIGNNMTTDTYAVYANAAKELPIAIVASAFTAVLLPQFARLMKKGKHEEAVNLWCKTVTLTYIIVAFIVAGCFAFAPEAIRILYAEKYLEGTTVFRIYTLCLLLRVTYYGIILNSQGKTKLIFLCSVLSLVMNVLFNYTFFFIFRFFGQEFIAPAVATVLSTFIMLMIQLIATSKSVNIKLSKLQPWGNIAKITLINVVFAAVFFGLKQILPIDKFFDNISFWKISSGDIIEALMLALVWGALYFALMIKPFKKLWKSLNSPE